MFKLFTVVAALVATTNAFGGRITPAQVETVMMNAMNTLKDYNLNPGLGWTVTDQMNVDLIQQNNSQSCVIPTPGGGKCICQGGTLVTVSFPTLTAVSTLKLGTWVKVTAANDTIPGNFEMTIQGTLGAEDIAADGISAAEASACGVKPRVHGTASTRITATAPITIAMTGQVPNASANCIHITASSVLITFDTVTLHDTAVNIVSKPLPPIPAERFDYLVDLDIPLFTAKLQTGVQQEVSNLIVDTINNRLPGCIPMTGPIPAPSPQPHPAPPPSPPAACFPVGCGPSYLKKADIKGHCCSGQGVYHPGCRGSRYRCCEPAGCHSDDVVAGDELVV